ncbi:UDP-glucose 4-epimerase GalE [uncultured Intestinimonas sp.]|uniref:UDP-glucose 4-epimerase GalE n=1 Tax=uncultured Intestinimonas sp. TaxID=1689265 RepID=UPI00261D779D|nr:UDP-glucose 4-epimerase GalE [uncultured Intestinimonas sp.]
MSILVTGGAGYIGTHTCVELLQAGYKVVAVDSLVNSSRQAVERAGQIAGEPIPFIQADLCDGRAVEEVFRAHPGIRAVIHFAALKAVGESVSKPLEYYQNNLVCTLNVLAAMRRHGVRDLVFSSSATVYGDPSSVPIREDAPLSATNPYGYTKLFIERILTDCCAADPAWNIALLRYFNPIGAHPSGLIGEDPRGVPNNLVPYIAKVAAGQLPELRVFGGDWPTHDGTGVRDYIHVCDLARGHVAALKRLEKGCGLLVCNLGTGKGYSVLDVLHAYEKACGRALPYSIAPRRPGDVAACWADPARAREELGWEARYGIEEMCADSWNWQRLNPNGYGD